MGINFRKSIKVAPGVKLNLGKKAPVSVLVENMVVYLSIPKAAQEQEFLLLALGYLIPPKSAELRLQIQVKILPKVPAAGVY